LKHAVEKGKSNSSSISLPARYTPLWCYNGDYTLNIISLKSKRIIANLKRCEEIYFWLVDFSLLHAEQFFACYRLDKNTKFIHLGGLVLN